MKIYGYAVFLLIICLLTLPVYSIKRSNRPCRFSPHNNEGSSSSLKLRVTPRTVKIDNGIVKLRLINPTGLIKGISYNGACNLLERTFKENERGYWDIMWSRPEIGKSNFDKLECTKFRIIAKTKDKIEVSFTRTWNLSDNSSAPLHIDKRYIVLRGVSGFYSYAIYEHMEKWPDLNIDETRIAFKLDEKIFNYMAISDRKQRIMPSGTERKAGKVLSYKESVLITNTTNPLLRGEVDDKYEYSCDNKDSHVHGWISSRPNMGFWVITPSDEFRVGGPTKGDLTSHAGPIALSVFFSNHNRGPYFGVKLRHGEHWKKVFGPVFIYLNSNSNPDINYPRTHLWRDARKQMLIETKKWPYNFPSSKDFLLAKERGAIRGRLLVYDEFISSELIPARSAYVGLAPPGAEGSFEDDSKGYQFWTRSDKYGFFNIIHVRSGIYNLYAWVPGFIGDFKHEDDVVIKPGCKIQTGELVYNPPRSGPTLWEIGVPDRTAFEFYVPDPSPKLINKLYLNHPEKYRQYGLWERYKDLYPTHDVIYNVGYSNYRKDWFFAQVTRDIGNKTYMPTTWQIRFDLKNMSTRDGDEYTLRIALASATMADLQVWVNKLNTSRSHFTSGRIGRDNAIARHAIHGKYWLYSVAISGSQLVNGNNIIYLKQATDKTSTFAGVLYDYIRLEAPSQ